MKRTIKRSLMLAPAVLLTAVFISPADASTTVVHDPKGDQLTSDAPYLDVKRAQLVDKERGTLRFKMKLAGPVPGLPSEPVLIWPFHVDTVPNTLAGSPPLYNEYIVRVRRLNGVFDAHLVNRTTTPPTVTPIPFSVDGSTIEASVDLGLLGNPSSFGWNAATRPGTAVPYQDFAPDGGTAADLVTWSR